MLDLKRKILDFSKYSLIKILSLTGFSIPKVFAKSIQIVNANPKHSNDEKLNLTKIKKVFYKLSSNSIKKKTSRENFANITFCLLCTIAIHVNLHQTTTYRDQILINEERNERKYDENLKRYKSIRYIKHEYKYEIYL